MTGAYSTLPSNSRVARVEVKFADGRESRLPIRPITQMQFFAFIDELAIKDFSELTGAAPTLQAMRLMQKVAAHALSVQGTEWTVQKLQESFGNFEEIAKIFNACIDISGLPGYTKNSAGKHSIQAQKSGAYG